MTEQEFFTVERDAALEEMYHGTKIADIFSEKIKTEYPGAKITDAGIHYAFGCQLDMTWRNRKFEKRPSKTEPIVPATSIEELKLWEAVDVGRSGNFEEELSDTCYSEDCKNCHGKGHLECPSCHGSGKEECSECHGHEPHKCPDCGGKGSVRKDCYSCDGTGRSRCSDCNGRGSVPCPRCNGEGRVRGEPGDIHFSHTCPNCKGLGRLTCPSCNGNGSKVCMHCGGRGGETYRCGTCNGTGELHHCERCHDKGVLRCHTCKGEKQLHCEKCGDVGHHSWVYYLIQQEKTKTIRSVSVAHAWVGKCRDRYKKMSAESDCDRMEFAITGEGGLSFGSDQIPDAVRKRVAKMWQAMFWEKEFKEYDDDRLNEESSKSDSGEKKSDNNSDWGCRVVEGKLIVTKIDTHAYVNIQWKNKKSTLFFEPCGKRFISSQALSNEKTREDKSRMRRKSMMISLCELCVIGSIAYLVGVHYDYFKQPIVKRYLSIFIEHYITMQISIGEKCPSVYAFWNWPAVMSLMTISLGVPLAYSRSVGKIVGAVTVTTIGGILSAIILMIALPFMDGISWYLAAVVDFVALSMLGRLFQGLDGKSINGFIANVADLMVIFAISYVVCHFFI